MVVVDLEKQELALKDEIATEPPKAKHQRSRRAKIWIRLSISILFLLGIHTVLTRRKLNREVVDALEELHSVSESETGFTLLDSLMNRKKVEDLFL